MSETKTDKRMSGHTKGPWHIVPHQSDLYAWGPDRQQRGYIARVNTFAADSQDAAERVGNARLIAAAPELLEALKMGEGALQSFVDGNPSPDLRAINAICDAMRQAIARATEGE